MRAYIISLPHRRQRAEAVAAKVESLGLEPRHANGVVSKVAPGDCRSPGEYGCMLAHLAVMRKIVERDEPAFVFEDDVRFHKMLTEKALMDVRIIFQSSPMVLLGATQYNWSGVNFASQCYTANRKTFGTFATLIAVQSARRYIRWVKLLRPDAVDRIFQHAVYSYGDVPVCYPAMAIADVSTSDVRSLRNPEKHARQTRWDLSLYE